MVASPSPQLSAISRLQIHLGGEFCPYCEQPIPNEKAEQVRARTEAKERELSESVTARLTQEFALEKAQMETGAKALVDQARNEGAAALEKVKSEIASREAVAREDGKKAAEAMLQERLAEHARTSQALIAALQEKLVEAEKSKREAAGQVEALKASHATELDERIQQARDALEADKTNSLNAVNAKHFEDTQKLSAKLEDLARQLEKKTANELGEGAEIDLFEALKDEFEGDRIKRVGKGAAGADIIHMIIHNDKVCGKIVYDSKNRSAWRNEHVTKLRDDQVAEKAEHAILAALKFPSDQRQLCIQDGVIIANPARVVALVQMIRRHVVQVHTLRLSNTERAKKTAELYDFIRSERCTQLFERIDGHAESLFKLQEQEKKAHDATWNRQGTLYRGIQKTCGELTSEIDRIIGTGSDAQGGSGTEPTQPAIVER
jgi:hypothetical protein